MPGPLRFVLASGSPRRRDLLTQIGCVPDCIIVPEIDESVRAGELPAEHARRLAGDKALAIAARADARGAVVLAADTVVACGRRILPKTEDAAAARACLALLSGRRHKVHGAVAVIVPGAAPRLRAAVSTVAFKRLTAREIEAYVACGEWQGKAGGYAIQGRAAVFVRFLSGSYSNVVGLPLYETARLLEAVGVTCGEDST